MRGRQADVSVLEYCKCKVKDEGFTKCHLLC